ncbi:hypothetical protein ES703_88874 [subsurface metagenome]
MPSPLYLLITILLEILSPVINEEVTTYITSTKSQRLIITISQTSDEDSDIARLHKLIGTLHEFPGRDETNLRVTNKGKVINLKLSNIYTNYCPELHGRLVELVGEDSLKLEPATP